MRFARDASSFSNSRTFGLLQRFRGPLTLTLALLFAWLAHEQSGQSSMRQWENTHGPDSRTWTEAFRSRGYQEVTRAREITDLEQRLLSPAEARVWCWVSRDFGKILVREDATRLFERMNPSEKHPPNPAKPADPREWISMGPGWKGFEALKAALDRQPPPSPAKTTGTPPARTARPLKKDPLELSY